MDYQDRMGVQQHPLPRDGMYSRIRVWGKVMKSSKLPQQEFHSSIQLNVIQPSAILVRSPIRV